MGRTVPQYVGRSGTQLVQKGYYVRGTFNKGVSSTVRIGSGVAGLCRLGRARASVYPVQQYLNSSNVPHTVPRHHYPLAPWQQHWGPVHFRLAVQTRTRDIP
jgi:hypothetical protein